MGVSKYSSNMVNSGRTMQIPHLIKQAVLGMLYWWRLKQETENILQNRAFDITKKDNQPWLQNIEYFLYSIGMGDLWLNPGLGDKHYIKCIITDRLQNICRQRYDEYINSLENEKQCVMFNKCNNVCNNIMIDGYSKKG